MMCSVCVFRLIESGNVTDIIPNLCKLQKNCEQWNKAEIGEKKWFGG